MRNKRLATILLSLLMFSLITACGTESKPPSVSTNERVSTTTSILPESESVIGDKISIFPGTEIPYYDGGEHTDELGTTRKPANFRRDPLLPYGFYIFNSMEEYRLEDGTRWGMDNQRRFISLNEKGKVDFKPNYLNPSLTKYKEYVGTEKDENGLYHDYFSFRDRDRDLVVTLRYFEDEKEQTLPLFIDVLSSIAYVPDPASFEPGIDFEFPAGADADEEEVIKLVEKAITAMVDKDKAALRAASIYPDADYFDFLIDTKRKYRFTELAMIEPYDESTGRKNLHIRFEFLENGMVYQSGYIFTSLKDKDGKWKIANID